MQNSTITMDRWADKIAEDIPRYTDLPVDVHK